MAFTKEDVEQLSAALDEPRWVLERRLDAWKIVEDSELPHEKIESWRYTDFRRLKFSLDPFRAAMPEEASEITEVQESLVQEEGARAGYVVQRDADVVHQELSVELAAKGVILTSLDRAVVEHEGIVQEHLFAQTKPDDHLFAALQGALFSGGTFLFVPKGVSVSLPIESQRWIDEAATGIFPHSLIVVEEGAELTYFERFQSTLIAEDSVSNAAVEIVAGPRSRVNFVGLQEYGGRVWNFQRIDMSAAKDAVIKSLIVTLGGRFSRQEVRTAMHGEGIDCEMLGLYFAEKGQHFDFRTFQDHIGPKCRSDLLYKGALKDDSRAVYSGMIRVEPHAAGTDAYQTNRNLVLSDHAKADSKPELEILNNDVKCSHGASVGQMNEEEIFYLMSRGIERPEAERLIVNGFFEEVVGRVRQDEIRQVLADAVERKLTGRWRSAGEEGA
jgi:Fe-S cluster assembly protein SufD